MATSDNDLWAELISSGTRFDDARRRFLNEATDARTVVAHALTGDSRVDLVAGLCVFEHMTESDQRSLFPHVLRLAAITRYARLGREAIKTLPARWVVEDFDQAAAPILQDAERIEYSLLLSVLMEVDLEFAETFARRAASHSDYDISEVGTGGLKMLEEVRKRRLETSDRKPTS